MGPIYYKCPGCGCWRKSGKPITLNKLGEKQLLEHIENTKSMIDRTSWLCPVCRIRMKKEE